MPYKTCEVLGAKSFTSERADIERTTRHQTADACRRCEHTIDQSAQLEPKNVREISKCTVNQGLRSNRPSLIGGWNCGWKKSSEEVRDRAPVAVEIVGGTRYIDGRASASDLACGDVYLDRPEGPIRDPEPWFWCLHPPASDRK